ncbi:MAG: HAD-IA family hydrolase [Alphaproteobacteria bacterium]|nr:HAD-IA family hydrolase [Alphaproteobacteria bacterium]
MEKPDLIMFDWDGTLVDTFPVIFAANNKVFESYGMPTFDEETARKSIRLSARDRYPQLFGDQWEQAVERYIAFIEERHIEEMVVFEGAEDLLKFLKQKDIKAGVITNKRQKIFEKELMHLGWQDYFVTTYGSAQGSHDKPHPQAWKNALEGLDHKNIWYVGDTGMDVKFGKENGALGVYMTHGIGGPHEGTEAGAFKVFHNLKEFKGVIESL